MTMGKWGALAAVLAVAVLLVAAALALQYFNVAYWQNLAGLAGVLFFAFFAIVIGAISKRILPSVTGSAAITALLMAYVYPAFAILMGVLFVAALGLTALVVYYDSQSPAYSGGWY